MGAEGHTLNDLVWIASCDMTDFSKAPLWGNDRSFVKLASWPGSGAPVLCPSEVAMFLMVSWSAWRPPAPAHAIGSSVWQVSASSSSTTTESRGILVLKQAATMALSSGKQGISRLMVWIFAQERHITWLGTAVLGWPRSSHRASWVHRNNKLTYESLFISPHKYITYLAPAWALLIFKAANSWWLIRIDSTDLDIQGINSH